MIEVVAISFLKAYIISKGLNSSLRQQLELTFHIRSSLDFCHNYFLHPISPPSNKGCWYVCRLFPPDACFQCYWGSINVSVRGTMIHDQVSRTQRWRNYLEVKFHRYNDPMKYLSTWIASSTDGSMYICKNTGSLDCIPRRIIPLGHYNMYRVWNTC